MKALLLLPLVLAGPVKQQPVVVKQAPIIKPFLPSFPSFIPRPVTPIKPLIQPKKIIRPVKPLMPAMDPMMMMLLMKDSSDMSSLLPLMMMQQPGQSPMHPLMMLTLLDSKVDDCKLTKTSLFPKFSITDQKKMARGDYFRPITSSETAATIYAAASTIDAAYKTYDKLTAMNSTTDKIDHLFDHLDYGFIHCEAKRSGKSSMSKMLPFMMMSGGMGNMDPMMMLMLMDDNSMDDMLPIMMMSQNQPGSQMNPLMFMTLLDDTDTKTECDEKYKLNHAYVLEQQTDKDIFKVIKYTTTLDSRKAFLNLAETFTAATGTVVTPFNKVKQDTKYATKYEACIKKATKEGTTKSSTDKLLPLMLMGGMGGGQMDPMMMTLLLK